MQFFVNIQKRAKKNDKKNYANKTTVFCVVAVSIFLVFVALNVSVAASALTPKTARVVVLDAGHGGADGGVSGVRTGVGEAELNLSMVKLLKGRLEASGVRVVLTRKDERATVPNEGKNFKRRDMEKRRAIILEAKPDCVVSIHMNFYTSSARRGAQVFCGRNAPCGMEFASVMQDRLNRRINLPECGRSYSALSGEYYIAECTGIATVIVECGFLSNPLDEELLASGEYRARLAEVLADGIMAYLAVQTAK